MAAPAPTIDLTDLASVKAYLTAAGVALPSDDIIQTMLTAVSAEISGYCSRRFPSQSYSVAIDGRDERAISLPNYPITAVASLAIDGQTIPAAPSAIAYGFVFSETQVAVRGQRISRGFQNVAIAYTAGFTTIPQDLVLACNMAVQASLQMMTGSAELPPGVVSYKAGDTEIKFGTPAELAKLCMTPQITALIVDYRRVAPA